MNITRENIDDLNAVLTVKIDKPDYEDKVETVLKDYRKKANIKGFRPGMVPIGLIKKIYGKAVRIDEINKVVAENIQKYITDEKLEILGDPIPKPDESELADFDTREDFTFSFELGLSPSIDLEISENDVVPHYDITIDEKMRNDYIDNYRRRHGELKQEEKTDAKDVLKGSIQAIDEEGNLKADGPFVEDTSLGIDLIKEQEIKDTFIGKAAGDAIDFDIRKAFPNDTEIAGILRMKRDDVSGINGNFRFIVREISRFYPAEVNQELYDKIYGEGIIKSDDEFTTKIDEEISSNLRKETEYKLMLDLKSLVMAKTDNIKLPEEFLKRWLLRVNEKTTSGQIEEEFDSFRKDLRWQLIKNKVARENEIKISEEELLKEAVNITRYQFQSYGLYYATDEQIENYAKETLKREDDAKRVADKILEDKVIAILKTRVKLEEKKITAEEFNKLFE
ncbi:MAG TPA: trigger factor [Bacteroidales bacterium]|nr:trigger factor [Bacteroidales bacterium]